MCTTGCVLKASPAAVVDGSLVITRMEAGPADTSKVELTAELRLPLDDVRV